jgi:deoxyribose-phosphate aldolase
MHLFLFRFCYQNRMNQLSAQLVYIDMSPIITARAVEEAVRQTKAYELAGLCLPPFWIKKARRELGATEVALITVVGHPYGYQMTQTKTAEMQQAIADGASELKLALNLSALKSGMPWVKIEIAKCTTLAHQHEVLLTVALDMAYLDEAEAMAVATRCADAGADGIQLLTEGVAEEVVLSMVDRLRGGLPSSVTLEVQRKVNQEQAQALLQLGVEQIITPTAFSLVTSSDDA